MDSLVAEWELMVALHGAEHQTPVKWRAGWNRRKRELTDEILKPSGRF